MLTFYWLFQCTINTNRIKRHIQYLPVPARLKWFNCKEYHNEQNDQSLKVSSQNNKRPNHATTQIRKWPIAKGFNRFRLRHCCTLHPFSSLMSFYIITVNFCQNLLYPLITRVSTEINFVGISIGIPIDIGFWLLTKLLIKIIETNRNFDFDFYCLIFQCIS
jgi:hypothetical protein